MTNIVSITDSKKETKGISPFKEGLWRMVYSPYVFPTMIRKSNNLDYNITFSSKKEKRKYNLGVMLGGIIDVASAMGYADIIMNSNVLEVALFPIATNIVSGIYEFGRSNIKKLKEKNIEDKLN